MCKKKKKNRFHTSLDLNIETFFHKYEDKTILKFTSIVVVSTTGIIPGAVIHTEYFFFPSSHILFSNLRATRTTLALPPSSNSDPRSQSGLSSPLPTTIRAFTFIARRICQSLVDSRRIDCMQAKQAEINISWIFMRVLKRIFGSPTPSFSRPPL